MDAAMASALAQPSTPLPNQVAGHQGVMSDASGSLVIKVSGCCCERYRVPSVPSAEWRVAWLWDSNACGYKTLSLSVGVGVGQGGGLIQVQHRM